MTKILVTGAGGFVGTYLIKELQSQGPSEIYGAVYRATSDISSLLPSDQILEGDLTDPTFAEYLIKQTQPDIIYHLAALSVVGDSFEKAVSIMNSNTTLSYNLFEAVRLHAKTAKIIAICSANVYGAVADGSKPITEDTPMRPVNPYAVSKATQELLALQYHLSYGLNVIILRPFNHTGPGQTTDFVIPRLASQFAQIKSGSMTPNIEVGNIESVRDFTDVRDMVRAYVLASTHCQSGVAYNIGSGKGYTIKQIIEILEDLVGIKVTLTVNPNLVRSSDVPILIADSTRFRAATNYSPQIPLNQTIKDILNSYQLKG